MKKRFLPFSFFLGLLSFSVALFAYNGVTEKSNAISKYRVIHVDNINNNKFLKVVRANQNTGLINPIDVINAKRQATALQKEGNREELNWSIIGPDNFGGRTRAIIYDNQDASGNIIYAGGVTGGIWKSSDNGVGWEKINLENDNLNVTCMCQGTDGTIYVGTGEMFDSFKFSMFSELGYSTGFMGSGLYKSTDGNNFELLESTKPEVGNTDDDWAFINEVQVDNNGKIYAATNSGLRFSDDGGVSWSLAKDTSGIELSGVAMDVKVGEGVVLVAVNNKCYYSSGDPLEFKYLSTGEENKLPLSDDLARVEFGIAPSDNSIVYASVVKSNGNLEGIYRSENSGEDWSVILPGSNSLNLFFFGGMYYNNITVYPNDPDKVLLAAANLWIGYKTNETGLFYWEEKSSFLTLPFSSQYVPYGHQVYAFNPKDPNEFMIGTNSGIFKGKISGDNFLFNSANNKYYTTQFYTVGISGMKNYVMGGTNENSVIIMDQQSNSPGYGRPLLGFQQGYTNTTNGGCAAVSLINPNIVLVGSARGTVYRSEDRGENYSVNFKDGVEFNEDFYSPFALWESFDNENSRDSVMFYAGNNTYPGGTTITIKSANSDYPFEYSLPDDVTLNPGDSIKVKDPISSRVFLGSTHHVYMTKDLHLFSKTAEWFEIANASTGFEGTANAIAYSSDANHLFVGTTEGGLYRISNLALAYNKELADVNEPTCIVAVSKLELIDPETGNPVTQAITSISVDPQNSNNVLVTLGNYGNKNYVFQTNDAISQNPTFVSKQGDLPQMPVYSSVIEMKNENIVIIGTDMGIYMTNNINDANVQWVKAYGNMGTVPVLDLKQQVVAQPPVTLDMGGDVIEFPGATNYGYIYAATYGRGIFKCDDFKQPVGIGEIYSDNNINNSFNISIYPNPVGDFLNLKVDTKDYDSFDIKVFDLNGKMLNESNKMLKSGVNDVTIDVSKLSYGTYFLMIKNKSGIKTQKFVKY